MVRELTPWQPPAAPARLAASPDAGYDGCYRTDNWDVVVTRDGDGLAVGVRITNLPAQLPDSVRATFEGPPVPVVLVAPDVLALRGSPTTTVGDFVRGPDGNVRFLRWALRLSPRVG